MHRLTVVGLLLAIFFSKINSIMSFRNEAWGKNLIIFYSYLSQTQAIEAYLRPLLSFFGLFSTFEHEDIILNRSNNSVFLLQKSIEIGKPLISSAPREFE